MQYGLTIVVIVLVFSYVLYRSINYFRKTRKYFIGIDDVLRNFYVDNNCHFPFDEFKSLWIAVSKNLGCPDGQMVENCKISLLMASYPFPEMFVDDIFMDFEKYSKFSWSKEMLFGKFIVSLCESININKA